jgi:hypothetical protein
MGAITAEFILEQVSYALIERVVNTTLNPGNTGEVVGTDTVVPGSMAGIYPGAELIVSGQVNMETTSAVTDIGNFTVEVPSVNNVFIGQLLTIDIGSHQEVITVTNYVQIPGSLGIQAVFTKTHLMGVPVVSVPNAEVVSVISTGSTYFTAMFLNPHSGSDSVVGATFASGAQNSPFELVDTTLDPGGIEEIVGTATVAPGSMAGIYPDIELTVGGQVETDTTSAVTSTGLFTVQVASISGIYSGQSLTVDTGANQEIITVISAFQIAELNLVQAFFAKTHLSGVAMTSAPNTEVVTVISTTNSTFTATFLNGHSGTDTVTGETSSTALPDALLWTQEEMLSYLVSVQNDFLCAVRPVYAIATQLLTANNAIYPSPADAIRVERISINGTELWNMTQTDIDWQGGYSPRAGQGPFNWYQDKVGAFNFAVDPVPQVGNIARIFYSQLGSTSLGLLSTLTVPDIFWPAMKWGVLALALSKDGENKDLSRSAVCQNKFGWWCMLATKFLETLDMRFKAQEETVEPLLAGQMRK